MTRHPVRVAKSYPVRGEAGFSLLELMVSLGMLLLVMAAIFEQVNQMQRRSAAEAAKLDASQQAREFVDQTVRDLHMAGYPKAAMFAAASTINDPWVAAGLVSVSPTQIILEGDVNSEGQVYSVNIGYVAAAAGDPNCPCIRRSAVPKVAGSPLAQPVSLNYTETERVLPPGIGAGQAGEDLFAFYDRNGNQINVAGGVDISTTAGQQIIASISTVKINLSLLTNSSVQGTGVLGRTSLSATARLNQ